MNNLIKEGAVFCLKANGIKNHYHVVANVDAETGVFLLLGVITSHVEMRKEDANEAGESPETIVDITPEQCGCLTRASAIDCNSPYVMKKDDLNMCIKQGTAVFKCFVSSEITSKIRNGVSLSRSAEMSAKGPSPLCI